MRNNIERPGGKMSKDYVKACPTCGLPAVGQGEQQPVDFDAKGWHTAMVFKCKRGHTWSEKFRH